MSATIQSTLPFALMRNRLMSTFSAISWRLTIIFGSYEILGDPFLHRCENLPLLRRFFTSIRHFYGSDWCRTPLIFPLSTFSAHRWTRGMGRWPLTLRRFLTSTIIVLPLFSMKSTSLFTLSTPIKLISDLLSHEVFKTSKSSEKRLRFMTFSWRSDDYSARIPPPKRALSSSASVSSPHATHPAITFFAIIWHKLECRIVLIASENPRSNFPQLLACSIAHKRPPSSSLGNATMSWQLFSPIEGQHHESWLFRDYLRQPSTPTCSWDSDKSNDTNFYGFSWPHPIKPRKSTG